MTVEAAARDLLGREAAGVSRMGGGDLSEVFLVRFPDGGAAVLKHAPGADREARMLTAIAATGCPCPKVLAASADWLAMTALDGGGRPDWAAAGRAVAQLHAGGGGDYGWEEDHAFGPAAIPNAEAGDWPAFWGARRLMAWPDALPPDIAVRVERLAGRLGDVLPSRPRPVLLHGDLWSGNLMFGETGLSGLIDPACYRGHAEVDLAMLDLFGGLAPAFVEAYGGLEAGWEMRRPVYQLWPALVHLRLFGAGYRGLVERCLAAAGA